MPLFCVSSYLYNMQRLFSIGIFLLVFSISNAQQLSNIVPKPVKTDVFTTGAVALKTNSTIVQI